MMLALMVALEALRLGLTHLLMMAGLAHTAAVAEADMLMAASVVKVVPVALIPLDMAVVAVGPVDMMVQIMAGRVAQEAF